MDQLDLVRSKTDIVELVKTYVPLKKAGRNFKANCPFHNEKTPSFIVSPERQIFKCFGCQAGGDVFKFMMLYEKMDFGEALRFLAKRAGVKLKSFGQSKAFQEKDNLFSINHLALEYYHYILLNHSTGKRALRYLLKRGIGRLLIGLFKLGYAPQGWEMLQNFLVKKKGYKSVDLEKAGLIIKSKRGGFYDRFRGRIIFPLQNHRGDVLGFSGRVLEADLKGAKYINTPETPIYHKSNLLYGLLQAKNFIKKERRAVVVEGEFDVLSSYQAGVKNVVAIKGSALTENQISLIGRFCENISLSLDADLAGDKAARRGIQLADSRGLNVRVIQLKHGKDPDECVQYLPKLWRESVKKTIPVFDFYLRSAVKRYDKKTVEGKRKISDELVPIFSDIANEVIKAHYIKKLAVILEVSTDAVIAEMERKRRGGGALRLRSLRLRSVQAGQAFRQTQNTGEKSEQRREKSRKERLEEMYLGLILQKGCPKSLLNGVRLEWFGNLAVKRIFKNLLDFCRKRKFEINKFVKKLPSELIETLDRLYLMNWEDILGSQVKFEAEFEKVQRGLEGLYIKEKLIKISERIKKLEKKGKGIEIRKLEEEFVKFSKELKGY